VTLLFLGLPPEQLGRYNLIQTLASLPTKVHSALVGVPLQAMVPAADAAERPRVIAGLRAISWLLCLLAAVGTCTAAVVAGVGGPVVGGAAAVFAVGMMMRDRVQTELHARFRHPKSLAVALVGAGLALGLAVLAQATGRFGAVAASGAMGGGALAAAAWALGGDRVPRVEPLRDSLGRIQHLVGPGLANAGAMWARTTLYSMGGWFALGAEPLGRISMARTVVIGAAGLVFVGTSLAVVPRVAAAIDARDRRGLARLLALQTAAGLLAVFGISGLVLLGFGLAADMVPEGYGGLRPLLLGWSADAGLLALTLGPGSLMAALLAFRESAACNAVAGVAAVVVAPLLVRSHGALGMLEAQCIADGTFCVLLAGASGWALARAWREPR